MTAMLMATTTTPTTRITTNSFHLLLQQEKKTCHQNNNNVPHNIMTVLVCFRYRLLLCNGTGREQMEVGEDTKRDKYQHQRDVLRTWMKF